MAEKLFFKCYTHLSLTILSTFLFDCPFLGIIVFRLTNVLVRKLFDGAWHKLRPSLVWQAAPWIFWKSHGLDSSGDLKALGGLNSSHPLKNYTDVEQTNKQVYSVIVKYSQITTRRKFVLLKKNIAMKLHVQKDRKLIMRWRKLIIVWDMMRVCRKRAAATLEKHIQIERSMKLSSRTRLLSWWAATNNSIFSLPPPPFETHSLSLPHSFASLIGLIVASRQFSGWATFTY